MFQLDPAHSVTATGGYTEMTPWHDERRDILER